MAPLVADGAAPLIAHANGERAYPSANREKIAATVGPLLERGLAALVERLLADHATVAAGAQWDADGHLPVRYRALQPLRLLGEWLRANNPYAPPEPNPIEFDWSAGIPWGQLTPGRIFHVVFAHLDKGGSGCADCRRSVQVGVHVTSPLLEAAALSHSPQVPDLGGGAGVHRHVPLRRAGECAGYCRAARVPLHRP